MKNRSARRRKAPTVLVQIAIGVIAIGAGLLVSVSSYRPRGRDPREVDSTRYRQTSFGELSSFTYAPSTQRTEFRARTDPFPAEVRALDGKRIAISGYMKPMYVQDGKVREFFLSTGGISCCFSDAPRLNEIIQVTMPPDRAAPAAEAARVWGTLEVKEDFDDGGFPKPLYRIAGDWSRAEGAVTSLWQVAVNAALIALVVAGLEWFVVTIVFAWGKECRSDVQASFLRRTRT